MEYFLVNIIIVMINEVLRMGWKMYFGVLIYNFFILKSSIYVYYILLSSNNLKLFNKNKIINLLMVFCDGFLYWLMFFCMF